MAYQTINPAAEALQDFDSCNSEQLDASLYECVSAMTILVKF